MKNKQPHLLTPWRRFFQWSTTIVIIVLPFMRLNGQSVLRIDIPSFSLYLFGTTFRIEELYLFWLLAISGIFLFLLLTLVLGRVWCGWACPQTTLTDMAEGVGRLLSLNVSNNRVSGARVKKVILNLFFAVVGLLVGSNLVWYFVPPYDFFPLLLGGNLGPWPLGSVIAIGALVYVDLALLRRMVCKEFCPYGRFQTVLVDAGTLTLWCPPAEAERCVDCGACVRACPTGIDIRQGYQVECINCVQCLDACRTVMNRLKQPGIIRYSFGQENKGWRSLLTIRTGLVFFVFLAVSASLVVASLNRPAVGLKVARAKTATSRLLEDGRLATFFSGYLVNKSGTEAAYSIFAFLEQGEQLEIKGPSQNISLAEGEIRRFNFAVLSNRPDLSQPLPVVFVARNQEQQELARVKTFIPVFMEP